VYDKIIHQQKTRMITTKTIQNRTSFFAFAVLWPFLASCQAEPSALTSLGPVKIKGEVEKGKDLSAIASLDGRHGYWASDETACVQGWSWDAESQTLTMAEIVSLLDKSAGEIDLEGLTADPKNKCYYATGSHSLSRHAERTEADRCWFFQLPVLTEAGGAPQIDPTQIKKASLEPIISKIPALQPHWGQPVAQGGLDIEGLAYHDEHLYFGLRSPTPNQKAVVLKISAAAAFSHQRRQRRQRRFSAWISALDGASAI
jgi:hypothetical protein